MIQVDQIVHCSIYSKLVYDLVTHINETKLFNGGDYVYAIEITHADYGGLNITVVDGDNLEMHNSRINIGWIRFWGWMDTRNKEVSL